MLSEDPHRLRAGQVIVADPRRTQRRIARAGTAAQMPHAGGEARERLERLGHAFIGDREIAVPALAARPDQPGLAQPRQMP